jgi:hypothetical protein
MPKPGSVIVFIIWHLILGTSPSIGQSKNKAEMLAPGIISTGRDYCTTISPDGKTLYFVRAASKDVIQESHFSNGRWTDPKPVSFTSVYSDTRFCPRTDRGCFS